MPGNLMEHRRRRQRWAWTVPAVLLVGIAAAVASHVPVVLGIACGALWAMIYAAVCTSPGGTLRSTWQGMRAMWKVCLVLLMIGALVALWMKCGTITYLTGLGASFVSGRNIIWVSFLLTMVLSMVIGSCVATWSVLGPPLLALAPIHMIPMVAGAIISGGMVGDRSSPLSSSVMLLSATSGIQHDTTVRQLVKSAVLPCLLTTLCFYFLNATDSALVHHAVDLPVRTWWLAIPPVLLLTMAALRVPLLYNLGISCLLAVLFGLSMHHMPLQTECLGIWLGVAIQDGSAHSVIGGTYPMSMASLLILAAGAFQGACAANGVMTQLTDAMFRRLHRPAAVTWASYLLCLVFSMLVCSQMLSIVMSGASLTAEMRQRSWSSKVLLCVLADGAELFPAVIPWSLLGVQAAAILGVSVFSYAGWTWFIYLAVLLSGWRVSRLVRGSMQVAVQDVSHAM